MKYLLLLLPILFLAGSKPVPPEISGQRLRKGKDYALFFAVKDYKNSALTSLKHPIRHAEALAAVLHDQYDFDTLVVRNPTRKVIRATLDAYRDKFAKGTFDPDGQLFIYFTGHGEVEQKIGYFLPADADKSDLSGTGIDYNYYRNYINNLPCKHVLVTVDACFSGYFDPYFLRDEKGGGPDGDALPDQLSHGEKLVDDLENNQSRYFLTSAGDTGSPDDHNQFHARILKCLQNGDRDGDRMLKISDLWASVEGGISPVPKLGVFGDNDPAPTFLFFEKTKPRQPIPHDPNEDAELERREKDNAAFAEAQRCGTIACYERYLADFPQGFFVQFATNAIDAELEKKRRRREDADWQSAKLINSPESFQKYLDDYKTGRYRSEATRLKTERELALKGGGSSPLGAGGDTGSDAGSYPAGFEYLANDMAHVQGGEFQMGDLFGEGEDDEKVHTVTVSSFYLCRYEVTNEQFCRFLNDKGNQTEGGVTWLEIESSACQIEKNSSSFRPKSGKEKHPVLEVSWFGAAAYCAWLSEKTGKKFRLPTEAEWEYAAREKGRKVRFGNGKDIADPKEINFDGSESYKKDYSVAGVYRGGTTPVGSLPPANSLGLFDMSGNVWEWCSDWYGAYPSAAQTNPAGASSGSSRVLRGGSWSSFPQGVRAANRYGGTPSYRSSDVGFRLSRT